MAEWLLQPLYQSGWLWKNGATELLSGCTQKNTPHALNLNMIMDDSLIDGLKMIERENEIEYTGAFTCSSTVLGHMKFQVRFKNLRHDPLISRTYFTWFWGGICAHLDAICTVLRASADFLVHFLHYDFCAFCKRHIQKSPFWRFSIVFRKRKHFGNKEV